MNDVPISLLYAALASLLLLSAFFSSSETGMMSLNRYRLRHLSRSGSKSAKRVEDMLQTPDRLLGVILIGNNLVNNAAAALMTVLVIRLFPSNPDLAITLGTITLTLAVLVFSEVTPKTIAQMYPERVALPVSLVLKPLMFLLYPAVWLVSHITQALLRLMRIRKPNGNHHALTPEELRTLVHESGDSLRSKRQNMLLGVLELDDVTVEDIMVPRNEVVGINLDDDIELIKQQLLHTKHTRLPIYKGDLDKVVSIIHIRDAANFLTSDAPEKVMLTRKGKAVTFVPETTALHTQLLNFQRERARVGLVIDEYGDIQGLVTLEDILEEIVGDFTTDEVNGNRFIHPQRDGSFVIDGSSSLRDINRALSIQLPTEGAKTLNGLILEKLEDIPEARMSLRIQDYGVEILQIKDNTIATARLFLFEQS